MKGSVDYFPSDHISVVVSEIFLRRHFARKFYSEEKNSATNRFLFDEKKIFPMKRVSPTKLSFFLIVIIFH